MSGASHCPLRGFSALELPGRRPSQTLPEWPSGRTSLICLPMVAGNHKTRGCSLRSPATGGISPNRGLFYVAARPRARLASPASDGTRRRADQAGVSLAIGEQPLAMCPVVPVAAWLPSGASNLRRCVGGRVCTKYACAQARFYIPVQPALWPSGACPALGVSFLIGAEAAHA